MVNEKFRENVNAWESLRAISSDGNAAGSKSTGPSFASFFRRLLDTVVPTDDAKGGRSPSLLEQQSLILFLIHCFQVRAMH